MIVVKKGSRKREKIDFKHNMKLYWRLAKPYTWSFVALIVILFFIESARLAEKFLFKKIIDDGALFLAGNMIADLFLKGLLLVAVIYGVTILIKVIGHWIEFTILMKLDTGIVFDLKKKFFSHIVGLDHRFHTTHKTGTLISRLGRGAGAVESITDFIIHNFVPIALQIVLLGGTLIYFDVPTALAVFATAVIFIIFSLVVLHKKQGPNLRANLAEDREKGFIADVFTNIDSVKYFGKERSISGRFRKVADFSRTEGLKHIYYYRLLVTGQSFIISVGTFFVILFPVLKFLDGGMTIGTLAFIYAAYGGLMGPMFGFVNGIRRFYKSMADFDALFEYDKLKNEIEDNPNAKKLEVKEGRIDFDKVRFRYHDREIIKNLNLKIKPNEKVALVGHSGSGKTTLVKLLYRLYDVSSGGIEIDGKNIKDFKQESLRSEFSVVPQECILFDDTIYNNILFSRPDASRAEVMKAMRFAQLDKFVKGLSKGENTIVGERGVKLSGGEKQRVSIARAILADKKILVLDEATSSLDSKTEWEIQNALRKLMVGRTSIIIAHRLSTIMHADKIIVMDRGRVVQVGRHRDLIKQRGIYKELWNLQKGGYIEE